MRALIASFVLFFAGSVMAAGDLPGKYTAKCGDLDKSLIPTVEGQSELLGVYDGKWQKELGLTFIIYDIAGDHVTAYYSYPKYTNWGINKPTCFLVSGKIDGEIITLFELRNGAMVAFERIDKQLAGTYIRKGNTTKGMFKKVYP
jgi:hypothetical protein